MRRIGVVAIFLMLVGSAGFMAGCDTDNPMRDASGVSMNDRDQGERVSEALENANLDGVDVDYDRDTNVVHLKGTVASAADKARAEELATSAVGTSGTILNELAIEGMAGDVADDRDDLIKSTLEEKFENDATLKDRSVSFEVNNAVVTVTGTVRTAAEKARVSEMVRSVDGVTDFANKLEVEPRRDR